MKITLKDVREIINAMLQHEAGMKPGKPSGFAVVDRAGVPICITRMDGASPLTARVSVNKGHTCIDTGRDTKETHDRLFTGENRRDVAWFGEPRYSPIPGGILLKDGEGNILGAIGTSGRTMDEDEVLAQAGLKRWQEILKRKEEK